MAIRSLFLGAAALLLTSSASFASPVHSQAQLGQRHVNYAAAQWNTHQAVPAAAETGDNAASSQDQACPTQCR